MYILISILGYLCLATTNIFDKFILAKAVPRAVVYVLYSTIFLLPIFVLVPFGAGWLIGWFDYFIAILAGFAFGLALWAMYLGFLQSEVSHSGPLVGATTPFFVLILSFIFLDERLGLIKILGILVLIIGSLLISAEKSRGRNVWHKGMLWLVLSGLLYAISHVASKYIYDIYGFYGGLVWTRGTMGLFGLLIFILFRLWKQDKTDNKQVKIKSKRSQLALIFGSRVLAAVAVLLIQYAISLGSVTIVNALTGIQFAFLIIAVAWLTKFAPKLFKEKFTRGELKSELLAVIIIGIGLAMVLI